MSANHLTPQLREFTYKERCLPYPACRQGMGRTTSYRRSAGGYSLLPIDRTPEPTESGVVGSIRTDSEGRCML
jgi:hypothetical protein